MNRRTFLATALLAIAAPGLARATPPVPSASVAMRTFETIEPADAQPVRTIARVDRFPGDAPPLPDTTEELVDLGHFAYLGAMTGEYYVSEATPLPVPDALVLPAMFVTFTSSAGVAGFRQGHTLGMMQRGSYRWTLQASGGDDPARADLVTGLALLLAERQIGGTPAAEAPDGRRTGGLWDLLPVPADFPFEVRIADEASDADLATPASDA